MKTELQCISCFVRQTRAASKLATEDKHKRELIMKKVLAKLATISFDDYPPNIARCIYHSITEVSGIEDPYLKLKQLFNSRALELYPYAKQLVQDSQNSLQTAVRIAIAGNLIDFGIPGGQDINLKDVIEDSINHPPAIDHINQFVGAVEKAETILYLGDNCGEIVLDRILIEELLPRKIIYAVRSKPIINDVTIKDAQDVGLCDLVEVIENGYDAPGTILEHCSKELHQAFTKADLIISKGQGNYETLNDCGSDKIFFFLKAKCKVVTQSLGCQLNDTVIAHSAIIGK